MEKRKREVEERRRVLAEKRRKVGVTEKPTESTTHVSTEVFAASTAPQTADDPFAALEAQPMQRRKEKGKGKGKGKETVPSRSEADDFLAQLEYQLHGTKDR